MLSLIAAICLSAVGAEPPGEWQHADLCVEWSPRQGLAAVVFGQTVYLTGGRSGDVWSSEDGLLWDKETDNTHWIVADHTLLDFSGRLYLVDGGQSQYGLWNRLWTSANGKVWESLVGALDACEVYWANSATVHDGKIWVCGGVFTEPTSEKYINPEITNIFSNGVCSGETPARLQSVTTGAAWPARAGHELVSLNGRLWVIGGVGYDGVVGDIWSSEDGVTWVQEMELAPFGVRYNFATAMAPDGTLWLSGGQKEHHGSYLSDVWYTTDGVNWTQQSANAWPPRSGHAMVYFNDKLIVLGGEVQLDGVSNFSPSNDIYTLDMSQGQEGEGEGEGEATPPRHAADQDGDNQINLSELLRVIQFYNQPRRDSYWCDSCTEDGYALTGSSHTCAYHSSDYNPPDWGISLGELLRLIQFFNSSGYHACPDAASEDGFCVGGQ